MLELQQTSLKSGWLLDFLVLLAEGARAAVRQLERLLDAAEQGKALVVGCDRRARLPAALDAVLRRPVLTPKALVRRVGDHAPNRDGAVARAARGGAGQRDHRTAQLPGFRDKG